MPKLLTIILFFSLQTFAQKTHLHCGHLIDTEKGKIQKRMTITVEQNKIVSVKSGYIKPLKNEAVIDLKNKYVLPGLIDLHVHLESLPSDYKVNRSIRQLEFQKASIAQKNAKTTLLAGFTTVRDLGGTGVNVFTRTSVERGFVIGPRILTSGRKVLATKGKSYPPMVSDPTYKNRNFDSVISSEQAVKIVKIRQEEGVNWIKVNATGGVLSYAANEKDMEFPDENLQTIVTEAHKFHIPVAAHAHGREGIKQALKAGVKTIEHGTYLDDECISLFLKKGAYLVSTISAGKAMADSSKIRGYFPPFVAKKTVETGLLIQESFAKAYKSGVKIAFGSDAGVFSHGYNAKEFVYMTEAGMPVMEALKTATITNAKVLEMQDQIGSITPGKLADIIAVDENPETNVATLMKVTFVMKDGKVYKQ
jgi:imidazolonepropionase-like amidohydrolase